MLSNEPDAPPGAWLNAWVARERSCARSLHGATRFAWLVLLLRGLSRLTDGVAWYTLILVLPWFGGRNGTACSLRMLLLGGLDLVLYLVIKRHFARPRPFVGCSGVTACARTLDEFSFPSGHTLHAAGFAVVLCNYYPSLVWIMAPLTLLIGLSRVALGLHYPSDVIAGAAIGVIMAKSVLSLF
jgi:undecaprenyl-diphosphatase